MNEIFVKDGVVHNFFLTKNTRIGSFIGAQKLSFFKRLFKIVNDR